MKPPLTVGHIWVLNTVRDGLEQDGCEPTLDELAAATGLPIARVAVRLEELRALGLLSKVPERAA